MLPQIQIPVQIIHGDHDSGVLPVNAEFLHERLPQSKLDFLGAQQFVYEDRAEEYAALVIDWWNGGYEASLTRTYRSVYARRRRSGGRFDFQTAPTYPARMGEEPPGARVCSVTDALALVGDPYSLLVIREISYGCRRFTELLDKIGCSRDVLTARLRRLEGFGIVERRRYSERPLRYEYHLTESGTELRSIVLALKEWGDAYLNRGKEPVIFAHTCGAEFHARTVCAACGEESDPGELRIIGGTDGVVGTPW